MQIEFTAKFYDQNFNPKPLPAQTPVLYTITTNNFDGSNTTINGSVLAPANVISYVFNITLPPNTLEAQGYLLPGSFNTFSCGGGNGGGGGN
jgi:hypothetical protein